MAETQGCLGHKQACPTCEDRMTRLRAELTDHGKELQDARERIEALTAERALQSACMELDIRNIISVEVSEAIEPARDKTIKLCDRTMTIKMRDGRIFKVVTYYDDQYSVSISADRRTMKINASAIVYPGSRLATNDKERK
jgi:hypothetical protein